MKLSREQWVERLEYRMRDIVEALEAAVEIGDWRGVTKYAEQAADTEVEIRDASVSKPSGKRLRREPWTSRMAGGRTAGEVFGRGGRWKTR